MLETEPRPSSRLLTRRGLLKGAGAAAGLAALGGGAFGAKSVLGRHHKVPRLQSFASPAAGSPRQFISRPDLHPPAVTATGGSVAPGYLFLGPGASGGAQAGPLMVDDQGEPVWFQPISRAFWLTNFRRRHYRGKPVLTWWEGRMTQKGFGRGEGVIVDTAYREVTRVRAGNGRQIDMHEFLLTPEGTALFVCYPETVSMDLSSVGGPSDGTVLQSVIQEVDVRTGRVLLEWRSLEHVSVDESYQRMASPYDYLHVNSITVTPDGNLLLSARCTFALYKLDRKTGQVLWRLGGKRSDFQLGEDSGFSWQHDAKQPTPSTITLFDDGNAEYDDGSGMSDTESQSRGLMLQIDEQRRTARLAHSYRHPHPLQANAMGSFQTLPDGHVLVGWGSQAFASEFSVDGKLLADWRLGAKHTSYRTYRYPWSGIPADRPAVAARSTGPHARSTGPHGRKTTLYASWNGATTVSLWLVEAGRTLDDLHPVGIAKRHGFETAIPLHVRGGYVQVTAVDTSGRKLATSRPVRI